MDEFKAVDDLREYPYKVPGRMPYSANAGEWNTEKSRVVACKNCRYKMGTHITNPLCGDCSHEMITVV